VYILTQVIVVTTSPYTYGRKHVHKTPVRLVKRR